MNALQQRIEIAVRKVRAPYTLPKKHIARKTNLLFSVHQGYMAGRMPRNEQHLKFGIAERYFVAFFQKRLRLDTAVARKAIHIGIQRSRLQNGSVQVVHQKRNLKGFFYKIISENMVDVIVRIH